MLAALKVSHLLDKTASGKPVPGGGSMAALGAATAAGLVEMVANLTVGKKGYEGVAEEMKTVAEKMQHLRGKLLGDMDRDADAYNAVLSAFKLPKTGDGEKTARQEAIQAGLKHAARVPMEVAEDAFRILQSAKKVVSKGNQNAVTDGAVGAMMARTAVLSGIYNVRINLGAIKDEGFAGEMEKRAKRLEADTIAEEKEIRALLG